MILAQCILIAVIRLRPTCASACESTTQGTCRESAVIWHESCTNGQQERNVARSLFRQTRTSNRTTIKPLTQKDFDVPSRVWRSCDPPANRRAPERSPAAPGARLSVRLHLLRGDRPSQPLGSPSRHAKPAARRPGEVLPSKRQARLPAESSVEEPLGGNRLLVDTSTTPRAL